MPYGQTSGAIGVHSDLMKELNIQKLVALRLTALARDERAIAELIARISNSPDYLVEELMEHHGWEAEEAICAVRQLQKKILREDGYQAVA